MSIRLMSKVWANAPYAGTELLILLAVADFATDEGTFFASKATLAKKCRCSEDYVRKVLRKFCEDGVICVTQQGWGRGKATEFRFLRAVDNPEENPNYDWNLAQENPFSSRGFSVDKPVDNTPKTPTMSRKTPTLSGYNGYNNRDNLDACDFHDNPQPCSGCASEAKAGMCVTCHKTECVC